MGLWTRLDCFVPGELARLISERRAVRVSLMRTTIHLVTAGDCLRMRPVFQPLLERRLHAGSPFGRRLEGMDMEELVSVGRERGRSSANEGPRRLLVEPFDSLPRRERPGVTEECVRLLNFVAADAGARDVRLVAE